MQGAASGMVEQGYASGMVVQGYASGMVVQGYASGMVVQGYASGMVVQGYASGMVVQGYVPEAYPCVNQPQRVGSLRFRQVYLTEPLFTQGDQRLLNTGHSRITLASGLYI